MLDGVDDVDWERLHHAYGSAADIPAAVRSLRSDHAEEREAALDYLFGSIWHQGTVYPASAPAVPFLLELAADRDTPGRDRILDLVTVLAISFSAANLPYGLPIAELRMHRSERYQAAAYDAVAGRLAAVVSLLDDPDEQVAATAAFTLAWFPDQIDHSGPELAAVAADAGRPRTTRVNAVLALGMLGQGEHTEYERQFGDLIRGDDPDLRWAAAIATVTAGEPTPIALAELRTWAAAEDTDDLQPWNLDRSDWALRLLDRTDPTAADALRTARVRTALAHPIPGWDRRHAAAFAAFPDGPTGERVPFRELTGAQRAFVRGVVGHGLAFWPPWESPGMLLSRYHLPKTRLGLAWYAWRTR